MKYQRIKPAIAKAFAAIVLVLVGTGLAHGQLVDCSGSSTSGSVYQIYLDELFYAKQSLQQDPILAQLMRRLSFKLGANVEAITLAQTPVPLAFAFCENRMPSGAAQFRKSLIDSLDDDLVILELWGQLDATEQDGAIVERKARIGYVLIPVLLEDFEALRGTGFQFVEYPREEPAAGELVDLLEQSAELEAFVAVGVGINLLREARYDDALGYLCRAKILLEREALGVDEGRRAALIEYVSSKAHETVVRARTGSSYERSLAELLGSDDPCPDGR